LSESLRLLTDDSLLGQCRWDVFRGSGPGGQKRNKTSNAVRLVHERTGIAVTATESRSLAENKLWAVRRMRIKLAADLREPIDLARFEAPDWFCAIRNNRRIEASHRHPLYAATAGLMLDLLAALAGNPAAVAVNLGVSTTAVIRLLQNETPWWATANRIRNEFGLPVLSQHR